MSSHVPLACGAPFSTPPAGPLAVIGDFPTVVSSDEPQLTGSVQVSPSRGEVHGVVTPLADGFLVREGHVVTLPLAQDAVGRPLDLEGGRVERLPVVVSLVPCAGGGVLPRGGYELYVRVVLNLDDGSRSESFGGPWTLEVH